MWCIGEFGDLLVNNKTTSLPLPASSSGNDEETIESIKVHHLSQFFKEQRTISLHVVPSDISFCWIRSLKKTFWIYCIQYSRILWLHHSPNAMSWLHLSNWAPDSVLHHKSTQYLSYHLFSLFRSFFEHYKLTLSLSFKVEMTNLLFEYWPICSHFCLFRLSRTLRKLIQKFQGSINVELQQRACEYNIMFNLDTNLKTKILDKIPAPVRSEVTQVLKNRNFSAQIHRWCEWHIPKQNNQTSSILSMTLRITWNVFVCVWFDRQQQPKQAQALTKYKRINKQTVLNLLRPQPKKHSSILVLTLEHNETHPHPQQQNQRNRRVIFWLKFSKLEHHQQLQQLQLLQIPFWILYLWFVRECPHLCVVECS